jgi:ribosome recycling factor
MAAENVTQVIKDTDQHMVQTLEALKREYSFIRTGRANPAILDRVMVDYFGTPTPIKQVANLAAPEPRLITITPWDKAMIKKISDAITSSDLGLNPMSDGAIIRLPLPPLTTERRKDLAKVVARKAEESRIALRNVRRDTVEKLRAMEKAGTITEDELRRYQEQVQKVTDAHIEQIASVEKAKEREVMEA